MERVATAILQVITGMVGIIIVSEVSIYLARTAWNAFGPLSLIFTFELWAIYPIWWIWRQILGLFV